PGRDELTELGQSLDRLAGGLSLSVRELKSPIDLHGRILDAMSEGVAVLDQEGRIVLVNPALRAMLLLGTDAVGKLLIETVRHAELHNLLVDAQDAPDAMAHQPVEIDLPGLKPRRVLVHAAPLSGD